MLQSVGTRRRARKQIRDYKPGGLFDSVHDDAPVGSQPVSSAAAPKAGGTSQPLRYVTFGRVVSRAKSIPLLLRAEQVFESSPKPHASS